jgi:hypothetical protein
MSTVRGCCLQVARGAVAPERTVGLIRPIKAGVIGLEETQEHIERFCTHIVDAVAVVYQQVRSPSCTPVPQVVSTRLPCLMYACRLTWVR